MNITITQDNSRVEQLGSRSASIVEKLYELATDPNNTLTLEGNISGNSAYADLVSYLTTNYPDLIINATKLYMTFRDPHVASALLSQGVGDGTGITLSDLDGITLDGDGGTGKVTFKNNTDIEYFEEFKYFTNMHGGHNGPFVGCTNLKLVSFPVDYAPSATDTFKDTFCNFVIPSLKWFLEHTGGDWAFPLAGWWDRPVDSWFHIYIGNTNNELEDVVVSSDIVVNERRQLRNSRINTLTWETNSNIPGDFCILCQYLTSLTITGQNVEAGSNAFYECGAILTISGISNITKFDLRCFANCGNAVFDISLASSSVTYIGDEAFVNNKKMTGSVSFPSLTYLGTYAFSGCDLLTTVTNLGLITEIKEGCFKQSGVTSVVLPNNCTVLNQDAFNRCYSLSLINLGNVTAFGAGCFTECYDLNININTLSNAVTIGDSAFWSCTNITGTLSLPNLVSIGSDAFRNTNITSISNLGSITTLPSGTFFGCRNLTSVLLPSTLTTISVEAFTDTAITRLLIPEGVTTIQESSFLDSSPNISYVELPSTVSNINFLFHRMFEPVSASDSVVIVIKATTPPQARYYAPWAADSTNVTKCRGIYVPDASVSAYTSITDSDNPFSRSDVIAKIYPISLLLTDSPSAWLIYNRS